MQTFLPFPHCFAASLVAVLLILLSASLPTIGLETDSANPVLDNLLEVWKPGCSHRFAGALIKAVAYDKATLADELNSGNQFVANALASEQNVSRHSSCLDHIDNAIHKALLPLDAKDYIMLAVAVVTLFVAAGGGIGGGAVYVPMYILIGGKH